MKHYELHAVLEHLKDLSLVCDWDEATVKISGRNAERIKQYAVPNGVIVCLYLVRRAAKKQNGHGGYPSL